MSARLPAASIKPDACVCVCFACVLPGLLGVEPGLCAPRQPCGVCAGVMRRIEHRERDRLSLQKEASPLVEGSESSKRRKNVSPLSLFSSFPLSSLHQTHSPTAQGVRPRWLLCQRRPRPTSFFMDIPWSSAPVWGCASRSTSSTMRISGFLRRRPASASSPCSPSYPPWGHAAETRCAFPPTLANHAQGACRQEARCAT